MLTGVSSSSSDELNRQSSAQAKRREQIRRWDESETNRESSNMKISQRVQFEEAYVFLAACSSEDRDDIDKLLQRGVDINTSNIDGLTALHQASIDNHLILIQYLLNRNADINCQDNEGWTPLHAAASCGNIDVVKYLLSRGAIVDSCNNQGELPIDIAQGDEIINFLEEDIRRKGIDDQQSRNFEHQLMIKHAKDFFNNNFKFLSDTIVHARTGATALHVASAKGYLDVIDLLIRGGVNINSVDNDGWTPLHAAAHWDKHDVIQYLIDGNADLNAKNDAGQTPLEVCDGETFQLLKELKEKRPSIKNQSPNLFKTKAVPSRSTDEQKSILRSESHNDNFDTSNKSPQTSKDENLVNCSPNIQVGCTKTNQDEENSTAIANVIPSPPPVQPSQSLDNKINRSINQTLPEVPPRRWCTTDRTNSSSSINNAGPYVRRRSGAGVNESNPSPPSTVVSVTSCLSPPSSAPITNVTVTNSVDDLSVIKRRGNIPSNRDEEAEAQRKHRSAQARRERRSTQSVTVEDIKAAEQQIKNGPANQNELSNNKIGAPSTNNEHHIETERLQRLIEDKKDKDRRTSGGNEDMITINIDTSRSILSRFNPDNVIPSISANDSLNVIGSSDCQESRRRTNRVHNQRKHTGRIIWNDETKEVEIRNDSNEESHRSDDQKSVSRGNISRFESNQSRETRSQSDEPSNKSSTNGINPSISFNFKIENNDAIDLKQYEDSKRIIDELNLKVDRLERDIDERDQIIEKFKTSEYIQSSIDKREKRGYERKVSELEEDLKKMDSVKSDNIRLKEENAALIRVISKLSK